MENIFFDKKDLKYCGENVIIGKTVRIRRPQDTIIMDNVIIDDFTYIACGITVAPFSHISSNCSFIGGQGHVSLGAFCSVSSGCRLITGTTPFLKGGVSMPTIPKEYLTEPEIAPILLEDYALIGANTVILPGVTIPQGMSVGANSLLLNRKYKPWYCYIGSPCKPYSERESEKILMDGISLLQKYNIKYHIGQILEQQVL